VGKSAKDNDELTFRVARGRDLWLHAEGAAGSHVIVPLAKGEEVDGETLLDAATLAAHYSKLKNDTVVDVRFTRQADVRKPKGAAAGLVTIQRAKNVAVRMEAARIERLFGTREE